MDGRNYFHEIKKHCTSEKVCYFNVYKLTGWDPANVYVSKVNRINARKKA